MRRLAVFLVIAVAIVVIARVAVDGGKARKMEIKVTSTAFEEGGLIPKQYTCDGADISPPLAWESIPEATKSIALIADDPDAPGKIWVHWVIYDLPADTRALPEHVPTLRTLPDGSRQGTNDFGKIGYGGPCPPSGTHRYYFKVYALDTTLGIDPGVKKADLLKTIESHILAKGQLMGKYARQK